MTAEQRLQAARAFWRDDQAADDQVQASLLIAQQKKFRPKTVMSLDEDRKSRHLATLRCPRGSRLGRSSRITSRNSVR
jgi:hypothetical protein